MAVILLNISMISMSLNKNKSACLGDFLGGSDGKESACNSGDPCLIPASRRFLGERNGNPLQYYCLENSMDRGSWWAIVHGVAKSRTWLSN